MNFLAHALLAGPRDADRLGGLIGDFVKGPLPAGLPQPVAAGVRLHRLIDVYADTHPAFRRSRARLALSRRRVSGIVVDMVYDHFLARLWPRYHDAPLEDFAARMYALMSAHHALLPPGLVRILPAMTAGDWLVSYREPRVIVQALDRMALRLSRPEALRGAGEELERHYASFETDFVEFFADAIPHARACRASLSAPESRLTGNGSPPPVPGSDNDYEKSGCEGAVHSGGVARSDASRSSVAAAPDDSGGSPSPPRRAFRGG